MSRLGHLPLILLLLSSGCVKSDIDVLGPYYAKLDAVPREKGHSLAQKKIFFGHKSVGLNIISGLNDVMGTRRAVKLNIRETTDPEDFEEPIFAHAMLGNNKFPESKIEAFREAMESGLGQNADIVFFKFCFIDIDHQTDLPALFQSYVETIESLEGRFPGTKFITFTVPLVSQPVGFKSRLKKILGRLPWYEANHIQRNLYNDMLRDRFGDSLFDLAAIESRIDDTRSASFSKGGKRYEILHRGYTDDGGHLNSTGRQIAAIELLLFLATLETD